MSWAYTMLVVHIAALCGLVLLYRQPPCWMQRVVVVLFMAAMAIYAVAQVVALAGYYERGVVRVAFAIEHVGVLLWVFRLIFQDRVQWTSSPPSRSSSR